MSGVMEYASSVAPSTPIADDSIPKIIYILQGIVIFVFAALIIASSIFNLLVIPRLPDISEVSKVFYIGLSISDLIFGITLLPALPSSIVGHWPFGDVLCRMFGCAICLTPGFSAGSLLLLNLDRFFTVVSPFRYTTFMTKRKAILITLAFCSIESTAAIVAIFINPYGLEIIQYSKLGACIISFNEPEFWAYSVTIFGVFIWSFFPLLSIIYTRIICISRRHARQIQVQEVTTATHARKVSRIDDGSTCGDIVPCEKRVEQAGTKGHRALKMTLLVTGAYLGTWIPFTVCQVYIAKVREVSSIIRLLATWPIMLNPLLNVAIYSATKKSYRTVARQVWKGCKTCKIGELRYDLPQGLII